MGAICCNCVTISRASSIPDSGVASAAGFHPARSPRRHSGANCARSLNSSPRIAQLLSLDFDLRGINGKKHYRHYYLANTTRAESGRFVLHEGVAMKLFTPAEIFALANVTPYDAFALWIHSARGRLQ
jgi:hypothetical protein